MHRKPQMNSSRFLQLGIRANKVCSDSESKKPWKEDLVHFWGNSQLTFAVSQYLPEFVSGRGCWRPTANTWYSLVASTNMKIQNFLSNETWQAISSISLEAILCHLRWKLNWSARAGARLHWHVFTGLLGEDAWFESQCCDTKLRCVTFGPHAPCWFLVWVASPAPRRKYPAGLEGQGLKSNSAFLKEKMCCEK